MKSGGFFKKTLFDVPLDGKIVLVRVDYNVPFDDKGQIRDDYRIRSSLPTINHLIKRGCRVVICSHLGRPKGERLSSMSLELVAVLLGNLLGRRVRFVDECIGDKVSTTVKKARLGDVILLENLRFHYGEELDDVEFARQLVSSCGAEYFVQDGFGVLHRKHASTSAITQFLPSVAGLLVEKEYRVLAGVMKNPRRPMVVVLGGNKISDKIQVVEKFLEIADKVIIGGAMANTFLKYRKYPIGASMYEDGLEKTLDKIYDIATKKVGRAEVDNFLLLPVDVAVAAGPRKDARRVVVDRSDVAKSEWILDIGPKTMDMIDAKLENASTVVWSGTLGCAQWQQFSYGSARLALALATNSKIDSVVGGGDTADFVLHWDARSGGSFSHVSTGGGASLKLMAGKVMPGIESLMDA